NHMKEIEPGVWTGSTNNPGFDKDIAFGPIPVPYEDLPRKSYGRFRNDLLVRTDVTYLRQDFSLYRTVEKADPWPSTQRFDYVVRTREISVTEAETYRKTFDDNGSPSPYHQAARDALRRLTGNDYGYSQKDWRYELEQRRKGR